MRGSAKLLAILITTCYLFTSCKVIKQELKTSRLRGENHLFSYSAFKNPNGESTIVPKTYYSNNDCHAQVKIREDTDGLFISVQDKSEVEGIGNDARKYKILYLKEAVEAPDLNFSSAKGATRPPEFFFNSNDAKKYFGFSDDKFRYRQLRPYIQALTIAVKFRKKIDAEGTLTAAPAQIEAGSGVATIALATGLKHSWNKYAGSRNALGFTTISHSLAAGILVGIGSADLKAASTRGQITGPNFETKNLTIPVGLHFVYGYNNINIGVAIGQDIITGPNRTEWNYFGKWWSGIVIGFDIIK